MWPQLLAAGLSAVGAYQAQKKLGQASDSLQGAGQKAFAEGQYKPYGVTTGAGTGSFKDGKASFEMSPEYQRQQDTMFGVGSDAFARMQRGYGDYSEDLYQQQRALGADARQAEAIQLGNLMKGSGMGGLKVSGQALGAGESSGMFNPQALEFSRAFAEQDARDRLMATQAADARMAQDYSMGSGMFSQGQGMDAAALANLSLGGQLGSQQSAANNAAMNNYVNAYTNAAGLTARRGQSIAGGFSALGSGLGSFGGTNQTPISSGPQFTSLNNTYDAKGNANPLTLAP
jgi:hypothetical protein